ncbi:hypothetical protein QZH41_013754 [Actinostola sp. cb2023]|nr:hypothetical protein QZH41_013754 [Actinostola sp. cb2023]
MKPPIDFSPIVQRACRFLKIGNRNTNADCTRRQSYKGISFSNEVYQETCKPIKNNEEGSWRSSSSLWHRNSASPEEHNSPRSSIRMYNNPWGRKTERKPAKQNEYEKMDELKDSTGMDEGIFTAELTKPLNGYLGLIIVGGTDTPLQKHYVKDILPNSSASKAGSVRIGDELIEVNGHALRGRTHSLALVVIRSLPPVIKLVIERSKDANRSILSPSHYDDKSFRDADPNITSPKARTRKRSVLEAANESSVITKTVISVIDIQRTSVNHLVKPAKLVRRESRCTSFIGADDSEDDDDVIAFACEETKSTKEGGVPEDSSDYDDRLSMLSNTSAWCARQLMAHKDHESDSIDTTSVFSMSTISDSLPGPCTDQDDCRSEQQHPIEPTPAFIRHGSMRERRTVTESIIEVGSDEEDEKGPEEPAMFLRRGSVRVRGNFSLRSTICEESEEERATWPTTIRRQRTSLNWDTFVPPTNKPIRRSSSACVRRPSSMYTVNAPTNKPRTSEQAHTYVSRKLQRTNSGKYIDKKTLATKVYRVPSTGDWGFTIGGGSYSPYGDLPIHVLDVQDSVLAGLMKNGDEIVSFAGDSFSTVTFLEADKKMKSFEHNCATIIFKRKFLQRKNAQVCTSYADAWNEQAQTARRLKNRPESLYC